MKKGFTLVEMVVTVFVFLTVIVIAGGSSVSVISLQRRASNLKKVEENGRYVLELMARELRFANPISTPNNSCLSSGSSSISFTHPVNGQITYQLNGTRAERVVGGVATIISNPDVEVTNLIFCVSGNTFFDGRQPRVTVILRLRSGGLSREAAILDLQTSVSQRVLNN